MFDNIDITPKGVIGVILLIICFIYILRRPGMSMMDNLMNRQKKNLEKQQKARETMEKAKAGTEVKNSESSKDAENSSL